MEIIIHGDKIRITKAMNEYIEEKLGKLEQAPLLLHSVDVNVDQQDSPSILEETPKGLYQKMVLQEGRQISKEDAHPSSSTL